MKKLALIVSFLMINTLIFAQTITLEDIVQGTYKAKSINPFVSSPDGNYYYQTDSDNKQIFKYSYRDGLLVDTILSLNDFDATDSLVSFDGFLMSPAENKILIYTNSEPIYRRSFKADYYLFDVATKQLRKLTSTEDKQMIPLFSVDGNLVAYVQNNDIYIWDSVNQTTERVTNDGKINSIINGATDWAYEEEFAKTSLMSFSPDNKNLAFLRFDESDVREFSFQTFNKQLYPSLTKFKYPKAGEKNSSVELLLYNLETKKIDKPYLVFSDIEYIPHLTFLDDSRLAVMTLNRHQNDFKLFLVDPMLRQTRLLFQDTNDRFVNYDFFNSIYFLGDSFTYISERDGYSQIYLYSIEDGSLIDKLTKGNYDVISILSVDPATNAIFYQAADNSPMERSIHRLERRATGIEDAVLSKKRGVNNAYFSSKGKYYINNWSDSNTPNVITVNDASGKELRTLEDNARLKDKLEANNFSQKEFIEVPGADGAALNAWILKPSDFDANKEYPLLMVQYSGPDSQQVLNQFGIDWYDFLVSTGYIVACVDGRGTGARGEAFRKSTYQNLGINESDDQIAAAKYFSLLPYIDSGNISIWGWSFGGYNVLMSLSRSRGVFKKGIAIAPVTDWRFYDSIYTERYMRTPQENEQGYDNGSPIKLAENLQGELLLIHGSADDNVHFQNSMEYISALIDANKKFEMFVFPDLNHSILGVKNRNYLYEKIIDFLAN